MIILLAFLCAVASAAHAWGVVVTPDGPLRVAFFAGAAGFAAMTLVGAWVAGYVRGAR